MHTPLLIAIPMPLEVDCVVLFRRKTSVRAASYAQALLCLKCTLDVA